MTVRIGFVCSQTILTCDPYTAFIIPYSGSATTFTFTDVTDTTGVAAINPTLCGPRAYSLGATPINNAITFAAVSSPLVSLNTSTRTF